MPSFDAFLSNTSIGGSVRSYVPKSLPCITNQALFLSLFFNDSLCSAAFVAGPYVSNDITSLNASYYNIKSLIKKSFVGTPVPTENDLPLSYFDFVFTKNDSIGNNSWPENYQVRVKLTAAGRYWVTVLRGLGYTLDFNDTNPVSILPLWAFAKAYYDLYYPKRYNPWHMSNYYKMINSFYNGDINAQSVGSLQIDFVKDFNVLQPLFGDRGFDFYATIDDSLASSALITPINTNSAASDSSLSVFDNGNFTTDGIQSNSAKVVPAPSTNPSTGDHTSNIPSLASPNTAQTYISADQLSLVHKLWSFVQKSSIVGQSVKDWFTVHLGLNTNEDMFDQTILIKSVINDVSINPVISTAQTASDDNHGDNLGALAGQGYASKNDSVSFEARTFGYFMCLTSLVPVSGVGCGTQCELYCNTLYEQQLPDFDGVGYEILNKTSFNESIVDRNIRPTNSNVTGGFGYVPRLSSWKSLHNIRSGNFAINSIKDSFLPYCLDVLPKTSLTASTVWQYPWSDYNDFVSFNRIFYNIEPSARSFGNLPKAPLDDNFISQSVFDVSYISYLKPLSDSYSIESLGNELVSVKKQ